MELMVDRTESTDQARLIAEKIRSLLAQKYLLTLKRDGDADTIVEHHCTASIGVTVFLDHQS